MNISPPQPQAQPEIQIETRLGLRVRAALAPSAPLLHTFYAGYDQAFVLPNEKEPLSGFRECLALNQGASHERLASRYGEFRETVMVVYNRADGAQLGGANFIAYPIFSGQLCLNLNYIFVLPEQRRKGHFGAMVSAVVDMAIALFPQHGQNTEPWVFLEQNDPMRMSSEDYGQDSRYAGLDQVDRVAIWAKLGARIVDFDYIQPALSQSQAADENLVYSVIGVPGSCVAACALGAHLERFFAISVLKGEELSQCEQAQAQITELSRRCQSGGNIALLDPAPALARIRKSGIESLRTQAGLDSLRALAR